MLYTLDNQSQLVAEWNGRNCSTAISRTETRSFGKHRCSQLHRNYDLSTLPETNSGIHTWNTGVGSDDPFRLVLFVLFSAAVYVSFRGPVLNHVFSVMITSISGHGGVPKILIIRFFIRSIDHWYSRRFAIKDQPTSCFGKCTQRYHVFGSYWDLVGSLVFKVSFDVVENEDV